MKAKEIHTMTDNEMDTKLTEMKDKLFKQRMQKSLGQLDNPHKIRQTRRDIARLLTIISTKRSKNGKE